VGKDEHWTGLGLDVIRTIAIFFYLDWIRTVNLFKIQELDRIWTEFNGKEMRHFCCEKAAFFKFFGLGLYS